MSEGRIQDEVRMSDIALPPANLKMSQDNEWCVVQVDGRWQRIRFHDYGAIYDVPGLYETLFGDVLRCASPRVISTMLGEVLRVDGTAPNSLRVLDLGAGNGMVGEETHRLGASKIVGVDIIEEAARAARRDRPEVYDAYLVTDMTQLRAGERRELESFRFNALTCVAALGFGDIPAAAFAEAFSLVETGGYIAFNIKENFLGDGDRSGFAKLIDTMMEEKTITVRARQRYRHRIATDGTPLPYEAFVAIKNDEIDGRHWQ